MSDARNSSNAVRGGGARQTGGAGRTQKRATGNRKTDLLGQQGLQAHQERSDAKRKLQLQLTSKQLAADVRAALLENHTEEEYEKCQVPLPSVDDAKAKLRVMKEFTENWYDKDFREEWLKTVAKVWLEELKAKYDAAVAAAGNASKQPQEEGEAMSIEELAELIANLGADAPSEERQRLKKKLKRKKQRAREKAKSKSKEAVVDSSVVEESIVVAS